MAILRLEDLPFSAMEQEVVALARDGKGIAVGPTGTGKTTGAPIILHNAGFTRQGRIIVTVPTRPLASELSRRVAQLMDVELGKLVGYQVRGEKCFDRDTRIMFVTEGILRGMIRRDRTLSGTSVVLADEFHMRRLMTDTNVALIERSQDEGSKVAFLLMSATVNAARLAEHYNCGIADGSHLERCFPVTEEYVECDDPIRGAAEQILRLSRTGDGNGMVFMPGKGEIDQVIAAVRKMGAPDYLTLLPMHSELEGQDRRAPFVERPGVTVVVTTDILETGATTPDGGWVVDTGQARERDYDPVSDVSSLRLRDIAQDRLKQRRGRAGRVRDGRYVGLYSRENLARRPAETKPEIMRVPLRQVVLDIKALGLSRAEKPIRLPDSPPKANWKGAKEQLQSLGMVARSEAAEITPRGEQAVELGCDPREAAVLIRAAELGCLTEAAISVAIGQCKPLFFRVKNADEKYQADLARQRFQTSRICDFWQYIEVVRAFEARPKGQSLGDWCRDNFVAYRAMQEVLATVRQHLGAMRGLGYAANQKPASEESLCRALLAGGLKSLLFVQDYRDCTNGDLTCRLGNESLVRAKEGDVLLAGEIREIQPNRPGARAFKIITGVTKVNPEWLIENAPEGVEVMTGQNPWYDTEEDVVKATTIVRVHNREVLRRTTACSDEQKAAETFRKATLAKMGL